MDAETSKLIDDMKNSLARLMGAGYKNDAGALMTNDRDLHEIGTGFAVLERRFKLLNANPAVGWAGEK